MALRVEKWGGLRPCLASWYPLKGVGTTNPGVLRLARAQGPVGGRQPLAGPAVAWVAEMGSAGGGKSRLVCKVDGA